MLFRLGLLLALVALSSCDSGSDGDRCTGIQLVSDGRLTATLSEGALTPNCYSVSVAAGRVLFIAYDVGAEPGDVTLPLTLTFSGTTPGTYGLDRTQEENESVAQLGATDSLEPSFAVSGSMTIDELSSARFIGTFDFVTSSGLRVSDGAFDVARN